MDMLEIHSLARKKANVFVHNIKASIVVLTEFFPRDSVSTYYKEVFIL